MRNMVHIGGHVDGMFDVYKLSTGRDSGASSLLGWHISADASSSLSSSVTSFRGSEISDAVSELGVELDEVLDESHEMLVNPSTARSLQRTTLHLSSSSA